MGWAAAGARAALTLAVLLVAAMALDAFAELPALIRVAAVVLAGVGFTLILIQGFLTTVKHRAPLAVARQIDQQTQARGEVVGGTDLLLNANAPSSALTAGLAAIAIERAARIASRSDPIRLVPASVVALPVFTLLAFLLVSLIASGFFPGLLSTQFVRFADPFGDHPPFSFIRFDVSPGSTTAVFGKSLDVDVTVSGGAVDRVELVSRFGEQQEAPLPMFQLQAGVWRATLTNLTTPGDYFVRAVSARSRHFGINILTKPRIEATEITVTPPDYAKRGAYQGAIPKEGIAALRGTKLEIRVASNRPLRSIELSSQDARARSVNANEADPHVAAATHLVTATQTLHVSVTDVQGQSSDETVDIPVKLVPDANPAAHLTQPMARSFATPDAKLIAEVHADDDYGVASINLYRSLNDSTPLPTPLDVPKDPALSRVDTHTVIDLAPLELKPGDVIKLFARAQDNDPAGSKGGASGVSVVSIISQAEFDDLLVQQKGIEAMQSRYDQASRRIEQLLKQIDDLQKNLQAADGASEASEETKNQLDALARDMKRQADEIDKIAAHPLPLELDKVLNPELTKLANAARTAASELSSTPSTSGEAKRSLEKAKEALGAGRKDLKQNAQDASEHLERILPLLQQQQEFIDLTRSQRDLADRMAAERNTRDASNDPRARQRLRELEQEQLKLSRRLDDLLDAISDAVKQLPEGDPNLEPLRTTARDFVGVVRASPAWSQMQDVLSATAALDGTTASTKAAAAAETLESFIGQCNGMGEQAGECLPKFNPSLASAMSKTASQLMGKGSGSGVGNGTLGSAGGASAAAGGSQQIGLYGSTPTMTPSSRSGNGGKSDRGGASDGRGTNAGDVSAGLNLPMELRGSGASDVPAPPQYRDRVGNYFRRVAEELGEGNPK